MTATDGHIHSWPKNLPLLPLRLNLSHCWMHLRKWPSYQYIIYWNAGNLCLPENFPLNNTQHELKIEMKTTCFKVQPFSRRTATGGEEHGLVFCPLIVLLNRRQLLSFRGLLYLHYDWISWPVAMSDDWDVKMEERPFKVLRFENDTFSLSRHATGTILFWSWLVSWHGCTNYSSTKANIFFYPDMNGNQEN